MNNLIGNLVSWVEKLKNWNVFDHAAKKREVSAGRNNSRTESVLKIGEVNAKVLKSSKKELRSKDNQLELKPGSSFFREQRWRSMVAKVNKNLQAIAAASNAKPDVVSELDSRSLQIVPDYIVCKARRLDYKSYYALPSNSLVDANEEAKVLPSSVLSGVSERDKGDSNTQREALIRLQSKPISSMKFTTFMNSGLKPACVSASDLDDVGKKSVLSPAFELGNNVGVRYSGENEGDLPDNKSRSFAGAKSRSKRARNSGLEFSENVSADLQQGDGCGSFSKLCPPNLSNRNVAQGKKANVKAELHLDNHRDNRVESRDNNKFAERSQNNLSLRNARRSGLKRERVEVVKDSQSGLYVSRDAELLNDSNTNVVKFNEAINGESTTVDSASGTHDMNNTISCGTAFGKESNTFPSIISDDSSLANKAERIIGSSREVLPDSQQLFDQKSSIFGNSQSRVVSQFNFESGLNEKSNNYELKSALPRADAGLESNLVSLKPQRIAEAEQLSSGQLLTECGLGKISQNQHQTLQNPNSLFEPLFGKKESLFSSKQQPQFAGQQGNNVLGANPVQHLASSTIEGVCSQATSSKLNGKPVIAKKSLFEGLGISNTGLFNAFDTSTQLPTKQEGGVLGNAANQKDGNNNLFGSNQSFGSELFDMSKGSGALFEKPAQKAEACCEKNSGFPSFNGLDHLGAGNLVSTEKASGTFGSLGSLMFNSGKPAFELKNGGSVGTKVEEVSGDRCGVTAVTADTENVRLNSANQAETMNQGSLFPSLGSFSQSSWPVASRIVSNSSEAKVEPKSGGLFQSFEQTSNRAVLKTPAVAKSLGLFGATSQSFSGMASTAQENKPSFGLFANTEKANLTSNTDASSKFGSSTMVNSSGDNAQENLFGSSTTGFGAISAAEAFDKHSQSMFAARTNAESVEKKPQSLFGGALGKKPVVAQSASYLPALGVSQEKQAGNVFHSASQPLFSGFGNAWSAQEAGVGKSLSVGAPSGNGFAANSSFGGGTTFAQPNVFGSAAESSFGLSAGVEGANPVFNGTFASQGSVVDNAVKRRFGVSETGSVQTGNASLFSAATTQLPALGGSVFGGAQLSGQSIEQSAEQSARQSAGLFSGTFAGEPQSAAGLGFTGLSSQQAASSGLLSSAPSAGFAVSNGSPSSLSQVPSFSDASVSGSLLPSSNIDFSSGQRKGYRIKRRLRN